MQHASHLAKPQLRFTRKVDNSSRTIWQPTLQHKFNAQVPLGHNLRDEDSDEGLPGPSALHPYRYEIKHITYPDRMFASAPPMSPRSFAETPFTWVADSTAFSAMLNKLRSAQEIAIDLEYHSYRTFGGFVCLMQLSTREEDWVVDTLAVRDEMEALNEVFTDSQIVKVLHGAESDIVWLQQDFNLYIVNLFDTYHASKVLDFPRHSLATLLEMYCDFTADKRYQLADWRIRPLPEEMLAYARSDTHFLLYIYDNLRNALLDRAQSRTQSRAQSPSASAPASKPGSPLPTSGNPAHSLVRLVLSRSEETALRVYEKETYDAEGSGPGGWDTLARKWNKGALIASAQEPTSGPLAMQRAVYRCVHAWRDRIAREEDESTRYILPNHYLFILAERPPADMAALLSTFQPVPPVVRRRGRELLDAIRDAVKRTLGPELSAGPSAAASTAQVAQADVAETTAESKAMQVDGHVLPVVEGCGTGTSGAAVTSLWSHVARPASATLSSALFGSPEVIKVDVKETDAVPYAASRSALFGERVTVSSSLTSTSSVKPRFIEVLTRIHSTLTVAPSLPKSSSVIKSAASGNALLAQDAEASAPEDGDTLMLPGTVELPFVPASERRQKARTAGEADAIVVVGQRQRKRKRVKGAGAKGKDGEAAAVDSRDQEEAEPFDYNAVSNILDEGSEPEVEESSSRKKKHKTKGPAPYQYGNFGAAPKAHSQPKSGNVSRTFR